MEDKMFNEIVINSLAIIGVVLVVLNLTKWMHNHSLGKYSNDKPEPKTPKEQIAPPPPMRPQTKVKFERILFTQLIDMVDDSRQSKDKRSEIVAWQSISNYAQENIKKLEE